jgi:hypothetical protein
MIGVWFSVDDDLLSISSNFRPLSDFIANQEYTLDLIELFEPVTYNNCGSLT